MPRTLEVSLNERLVGTITNLPSDQNLFVFDENYIDDPLAPVLSQGFYLPDRTLVPQVQTATKAPPFFSNLLPENELRSYLAERGGVNPARDFPLLWLLGDDLPGAVRVRDPEGELPPEDSSSRRSESSDNTKKLRFSLAGVQLKFSAIRSADGGLTIPARGQGGYWIVKLPSTIYKGVPENEWSMMTFARNVGITVPNMTLDAIESIEGLPSDIPPHFGKALSIERFDRTRHGARIHTEDFAQVFRKYPQEKYRGASNGSIAEALSTVSDLDSVGEFVRRLVFNIGIANADMHLKNWSLIYEDGRFPRLSPAYDYVSTIGFMADDSMALSIAGTKSWSDVSYDLLERFARRANVPKGLVANAANEMVDRMKQTWPKIKHELPIPKETIARIDEHQKSVPLFGAAISIALSDLSSKSSPAHEEALPNEVA